MKVAICCVKQKPDAVKMSVFKLPTLTQHWSINSLYIFLMIPKIELFIILEEG